MSRNSAAVGTSRTASEWRTPTATFSSSSRAYYMLDAAGRIGWMRLLCSGYRPTAAGASE